MCTATSGYAPANSCMSPIIHPRANSTYNNAIVQADPNEVLEVELGTESEDNEPVVVACPPPQDYAPVNSSMSPIIYPIVLTIMH